jgi:glutamate formiminotransferase/formiminotetrahydrofolate cyclodeaminase
VAAAVGALGAALATMVANLSAHKPGWDDRWEEFSDAAAAGKRLYVRLLQLVDEDTEAFNRVLAAFALPKDTPAEQEARVQAIQDATKGATEVPLQVMQAAAESMGLIRRMAETGLPSSVSDAGVGAICARAAVSAASLNVQINAATLKDRRYAAEKVKLAETLERQATEAEREIVALVRRRLPSP